MKTIIKTSVKGNENVEVAETVEWVHELLEEKGNFVLLNRVRTGKLKSPVSIRKSAIKMIVERS